MGDNYASASQTDLSSNLRDLEEKLRLLKDRTIIIGKSFVEQRESNFKDIQEMKKTIIILKEENQRIKELLQRVTEQLASTARKEDFSILQRQLDLIRK